MATDRPSFHESWYRVADLRPRLRTSVQTQRQLFRGQRWYVVQDPSNNLYFRMDDAAYHFVALLDGRRTVEEAWRISQEILDDAAPTQGEAIQLLGKLYVDNLIQSDLPADATGMFEQQRTRTRREVGGFFRNLLFLRVPLYDPDALLGRLERLFGFLLGPVGAMAWSVLLVAGVVALVGRFDELAGGVRNVVAPRNLLLLYLSFAGIKLLHELGHGLAAKRIGRRTGTGGEVHTVGITLLVFTPVPYVDASCTWAFPSKWHRALVGAAGMYMDLAVGAAAAIVWASTSPGLLHALAYNLIFVATVATVLFNANPLMRFDGYYIASDLLEIPNLAQRSRDCLNWLVKRFVFGLSKAVCPVSAPGESIWLPLYGVAASVYRVFIMVGIVLLLSDRFPAVGLLLAMVTVGTWLAAPALRFVRYLAAAPELVRVRGRAWFATAAFAAVVIVLVGLIPLPDRVRAEGVVEPTYVVIVHARVDGFVNEVLPGGTMVTPDGTPLLEIRNDELQAERRRLLAEHELTRLQRDLARGDEIARAQSLTHRLAAMEERIERIEQRIDDTSVHAPLAGRWLTTDVERRIGRFVHSGEPLGMVAGVDDLHVRAVADQNLGPRIDPELGRGAIVRLCVRGRPELKLTGRIKEVLPGGLFVLPSAALGYQAGGVTAVTLDNASGTEAVDPFFETHIEIVDARATHPVLFSGQRVVVLFDMPPRPLVTQAWRALCQLVQRRLQT